MQGFLYCSKLFEYERSLTISLTGKKLSYKQIYNRRLRDEKPVMETFIVCINKQVLVNGSRFAQAVTYASNQKSYMMTYLEDGHCSLSNNMSEISIRS